MVNMRTVVGLFEDLGEARMTLDELATQGIRPEQVSVIAPRIDGRANEGALHLAPVQLPGGQTIAAQGPMLTMLTPSTAAASGDVIVASLVRMGVPQNEAMQYVDGVRQGMTLEALMIDDSKAQAALDIMNRHGTRRRNDAGVRAGAGTRTEDELAVPVIEEELRVGKREVPAGGVRVSTYVTTTPVEEHVTLREERVDVNRRPANRPADENAFREQSIEVTATAEEPIVAKEARVVEEVVVRKGVEHEKKTIKDSVRKTDVRVEPIREAFDETAYRQHFDQSYGRMTDEEYQYEQVLPAYRYGHSLRSDQRFAGDDWGTIEPQARTAWEENNPGTWTKFKAAIRHAWERAKS
jgi:uncharacterized protein (TIGR02271 family)